ncbi:LysR family transcriptional regulator [Verrucosispora sp. NA02020]|uniref:LysR family transcriptional regulator n=1 Tax=Verrucosispora sp. NA02020 TaxID=2742132 RepID=UPI0015904F29|nr:LysR family transcriptional regulator [Verrucosispora sp. NA02020]QKW13800.1 LysR family transcriptional regulator [Verrucosispora sp. NA02020]
MTSIEVRQLEYFLAVHDYGGVTRAAKALHLSQPSLSQAIRSLERQLRTDLFLRVGRGLVLSAAGQALVGPARQVVRSVERAQVAVQRVRELHAGQISVAAGAGLVADPLAPWLGRFRRKYPDTVVRVEESESDDGVAELVRSGDCELGLTAGLIVCDELEQLLVSEQHVVLVSPPGTPCSGGPVPLEQLAGVPMVVGDRRGQAWTDVERAMAARGVAATVVVEVARTSSTIPLVLAGVGSTFLTLRLAIEARARGAVVQEITPAQVRRLRLLRRPGDRSVGVNALTGVIHADAKRWVTALQEQQDLGLGLVAAGAAVDARIRDARAAAASRQVRLAS